MTSGPHHHSKQGSQPHQGPRHQRYPTRSNISYDAPKMLYFNSNDSSHFEKWRQGIIAETTKLFGTLSSIFIMDAYPDDIPLPEAPDQPLNDDTDPGGIQRE